jgi:hypothetical protein
MTKSGTFREYPVNPNVQLLVNNELEDEFGPGQKTAGFCMPGLEQSISQ